MSELTKQAAYIKGLCDGMKLNCDKDENKILFEIIKFLENSAEEIEALDQEQGFLADSIDDLEDCLDVMAHELADSFDDCDDEEFCVRYENCGAEVPFSDAELDEIIEDGIECPECGEVIHLDLDALNDDCDCGCGCDHCE